MSEIKSPITLTTGADVAAKRLVKLSSSTVIHNTVVSTDVPIGITDYAADSGDNVAVRLLSEAGTIELTAAGVIAADAVVYAAAAGKVSAISTAGGIYKKIGIAIEAATADGDIIEILPSQVGETTEVATDLTVAAPVVVPGSINTIDSTDNAVDATLADDTVVGRHTLMIMTEASTSSTVTIAKHTTSDPEVATFNAVGEVLDLMWMGTEYVTIYATATFV